MTVRGDDGETLLLQEPHNMAEHTIENVCCFGMVSFTISGSSSSYLDTSPVQPANC